MPLSLTHNMQTLLTVGIPRTWNPSAIANFLFFNIAILKMGIDVLAKRKWLHAYPNIVGYGNIYEQTRKRDAGLTLPNQRGNWEGLGLFCSS